MNNGIANAHKPENTNTYSDMVIDQMLIELYSKTASIRAELEHNSLTFNQKRAIIHMYNTMVVDLN